MKDVFQGLRLSRCFQSCWALRSQWEMDSLSVIREIEETLTYPVFVKPASLGSSIGVSKAKNVKELTECLELAFEFDRKAAG